MPAKQKYRLQPLLRMKDRAKRQAEMALAIAFKRLEEEKHKLEQIEKLLGQIRDRREQCREDMRQKVLTGQARIQQSHIHLGYMRKLEEDEQQLIEEKKTQKEEIRNAEEKVKRAKRDYVDAAYELTIMEKHRDLWRKQQQKALSALENKEMNELGNTVFQMNKFRGS